MFPDPIHEAFRKAAVSALKELFEKKHLYQSVAMDLSLVDKLLVSPKRQTILTRGQTSKIPTAPKLATKSSSIYAELVKPVFGGIPDKRITMWNNWPWEFSAWEDQIVETEINLVPPSINVSCSTCKTGSWPHNPSFIKAKSEFPSITFGENKLGTHLYVFSYQCQQCKGEPLCFFIKRERFKFTMVGRSQFPKVEVPANFPEAVAGLYQKAIISSNTGFILAAALYLRAAVEQYFRDTIPPLELKTLGSRPTGDELGNLYSKTLPKEFPSGCPSLKKAYGDMSEVIHSGKENDEAKQVFEKTRMAVETHFEALELFRKISK